MKKEYADKWVAALRSGEFKQTTGELKDNVGHCCLGVLCEITKPGSLVPSDEVPNRFQYENGEYEMLPQEIMDIVDINTNDGHFDDTSVSHNLVNLNDNGKSFEEIAAVIEKHWEKL